MGKLFATSVLLATVTVYLALFRGTQFDPKSIRDQRVLVSGASSGIGEQLAYQYASLGARLVITARRASLLQNISRTCDDLGANEVHFIAADMADPGDRSKVVEHVKKHLGGLDHLMLNHAIMTEGWWMGNLGNLTHLERVHRVNFFSYVDMASRFLPMLTASQGRIGVVSSAFAEVGSVMASVYASCKFALHGFFLSLRQELLHTNSGVSVTLVVLGPVSTDAMMDLTNASFSHMPKSYMATPSAAARAVIESVEQRKYKTYFDWKMRVILLMNDFFPQTVEDLVSHVMLSDDGIWGSRIMLYVWRTFYHE